MNNTSSARISLYLDPAHRLQQTKMEGEAAVHSSFTWRHVCKQCNRRTMWSMDSIQTDDEEQPEALLLNYICGFDSEVIAPRCMPLWCRWLMLSKMQKFSSWCVSSSEVYHLSEASALTSLRATSLRPLINRIRIFQTHVGLSRHLQVL